MEFEVADLAVPDQEVFSFTGTSAMVLPVMAPS